MKFFFMFCFSWKLFPVNWLLNYSFIIHSSKRWNVVILFSFVVIWLMFVGWVLVPIYSLKYFQLTHLVYFLYGHIFYINNRSPHYRFMFLCVIFDHVSLYFFFFNLTTKRRKHLLLQLYVLFCVDFILNIDDEFLFALQNLTDIFVEC
jgi:hypothetical protein